MPGHRRPTFMLLLRSGVPLLLAGLNPFSFWQKEVPASKSEWDANDASQRVVSPCSCWSLLYYFSVSVRPLPPAQRASWGLFQILGD